MHNTQKSNPLSPEYLDYDSAQTECFLKQQSYYHAGQEEVEAVIFEADSIEDLKRTHSRYFAEPYKKDTTKNGLLAIGLVGLALYLLK